MTPQQERRPVPGAPIPKPRKSYTAIADRAVDGNPPAPIGFFPALEEDFGDVDSACRWLADHGGGIVIEQDGGDCPVVATVDIHHQGAYRS